MNNLLDRSALRAPAAREELLRRAQAAASDAGPVPSPCVSICQMDAATGLCAGCLRTLDEIAAWGAQGDDARRAVWSSLAGRAQALAAARSPSAS